MEKGRVVLMSITKEELEDLIENSVRKILDKGFPENSGESYYMDIEEAASFIKLAPQTIYGLTSKRLIPFVKRRHKIFFIKCDLERWLLEGKKLTLNELLKNRA